MVSTAQALSTWWWKAQGSTWGSWLIRWIKQFSPHMQRLSFLWAEHRGPCQHTSNIEREQACPHSPKCVYIEQRVFLLSWPSFLCSLYRLRMFKPRNGAIIIFPQGESSVSFVKFTRYLSLDSESSKPPFHSSLYGDAALVPGSFIWFSMGLKNRSQSFSLAIPLNDSYIYFQPRRAFWWD